MRRLRARVGDDARVGHDARVIAPGLICEPACGLRSR
jgi:hypothetical protein